MVQFSYRYNMADDIYFSGDEEWERAMVQAVEVMVEDYFSGDEVSEQAMVRSRDQAEQQAAWEKQTQAIHYFHQTPRYSLLCQGYCDDQSLAASP